MTPFTKHTSSVAREVQHADAVASRGRGADVSMLLSLCMLLSACAASGELAMAPDASAPHQHDERPLDGSARDVDGQLRSEVAEWAGTPHKLGGTSANGIDCSAFVQEVYSSVFNLRLPRTTREQVRAGVPVPRRDLRPGDLVFFKPPTKTPHVGIYLNEGEFAHASSSQGVMISKLDETYWDRSYWTSRRVVQGTPPPTAIAERTDVSAIRSPRTEPRDSSVEDRPRGRIGW